MNLQKQKIRNQILHEMEQIDETLFTEKCKKVRNRLFDSDLWKNTKTLGITLSIGREIETMAIITRAWAEKKRVAVPKCDPSDRSLHFYKLDSFRQLESGYFGLMEPITEKTRAVDKHAIDLLIVPGVGFDLNGYRIGYGGGYYDRFLQRFSGLTVSLLLQMQLIDAVPVEEHDQNVDWLITEDNSYQVKKAMNEKEK
ncbi:5-formyltetrahydrofolate cyclo-ligase [Sporolactobacillus kofuensis]|uniref:5-formyltetrahydrofolate cyclo-ligase n=1 Tax=Sporolactobacillus kofuensis TaxID=269672 RepID=A0ABW1WJT3_9BACL|nr:5-formyltetrahydrofolate cyclo-ligase [Sporolactobacillus kofuensis]MCO7176509.1 5-formyltetrahydrofolate cyclo-ligase [Sporolactobacillus kofuensis]